MIMKKREIVELNSLFNSLKDLGNTKFKYFVIKNISLLKPHVTPLSEIEEDNKSVLSEFEKERNDLIIKLGKPKDDGKVYIDMKDSEVLKTFNEELKVLADKYSKELSKYEESYKEFVTVLDEELEEEVKFRSISIEDCPEEGINSTQLEFLMEHELIK